jgi:hypothetical protein
VQRMAVHRNLDGRLEVFAVGTNFAGGPAISSLAARSPSTPRQPPGTGWSFAGEGGPGEAARPDRIDEWL